MPVYCSSLSLDDAVNIPGVAYFPDEVYPKQVRVVSFGVRAEDLLSPQEGSDRRQRCCSVELCAGTHVENAGDIGALVITNCQGSSQGTKRIVAVTVDMADEALENAQQLREQLNRVAVTSTPGQYSADSIKALLTIEKALSDGRLLPKVDRDRLLRDVQWHIHLSGFHEQRLKHTRSSLQQALEDVLKNYNGTSPVICELPFAKARDMMRVCTELLPSCPLLLLSKPDAKEDVVLGIAYMPKGSATNADEWASRICSKLEAASHYAPRGKNARHADIIHLLRIISSSVDTVLNSLKELQVTDRQDDTCDSSVLKNSQSTVL